MKTIRYSTKAKKDLKKYRNDVQLMKALYDILKKLANGDILPKEYKAHALIGNYKDCMECHIKNDFLLIWMDTEHDAIRSYQNRKSFRIVLNIYLLKFRPQYRQAY